MTKIEFLILTVTEEARQSNWTKDWANAELGVRLDRMLRNEGWYVLCSVTGERIPYVDLRYWSVPLQVAWARPELVEHSQFGY